MPKYGDKLYWENRYKEQIGDTYDWYNCNRYRLEDFDSLRPLIDSLITNKLSKVLIVGCGNSEFSEKMYDAGWKYLYNIDISETVVASMRQRNISRSNMTCSTL